MFELKGKKKIDYLIFSLHFEGQVKCVQLPLIKEWAF